MSNSIHLSDLLSSADLSLLCLGEVATAPSGKKYSVPLRECDIFYRLPDDINDFITRIYPNLVKFATAYSRGSWDCFDVLNTFVCRMLSKNSAGVERWRLYDPEIGGNISYAVWFISNLRFSFLTNAKKRFEIQSKEVEWDSQPVSVEGLPDSISELGYSRLHSAGNHLRDATFEEVAFEEIVGMVREYSAGHKDGKPCFEQCASVLLEKRLDGMSNTEIALLLGVSGKSVGKWVLKLRALVLGFMSETEASVGW